VRYSNQVRMIRITLRKKANNGISRASSSKYAASGGTDSTAFSTTGGHGKKVSPS
jgi:hypothetical protein